MLRTPRSIVTKSSSKCISRPAPPVLNLKTSSPLVPLRPSLLLPPLHPSTNLYASDPTPRSSSTPSTSSPSIKTIPVIELLMLFAPRPELPLGAVEEVLDHLWSLQYQSSNILCGTAGRVLTRTVAPNSDASPPVWTHALHLRFGNQRAFDAFWTSPLLQDAAKTIMDPICASMAACIMPSAVENDLMHLFRRGPEYEEGCEHFSLFIAHPASEAQSVLPTLVGQVAAIAASPLSRATQTSHGAIRNVTLDRSSAQQVDSTRMTTQVHVAGEYGLLCHFGSDAARDAFESTRPVQAMLLEGGKQLPARINMALSFAISPLDDSRTTAPGVAPPPGPWWGDRVDN